LLFSGLTGFLVASTEFFGEAEALREATRDLVSPVSTASDATAWSEPIAKAMATARGRAPGAPIDKITTQFKGDQPTVTVYLGTPGGGEDRLLTVDAKSGQLLREGAYADKPLLHRIHSGEFFGDGGLVFAMMWGLASTGQFFRRAGQFTITSSGGPGCGPASGRNKNRWPSGATCQRSLSLV